MQPNKRQKRYFTIYTAGKTYNILAAVIITQGLIIKFIKQLSIIYILNIALMSDYLVVFCLVC